MKHVYRLFIMFSLLGQFVNAQQTKESSDIKKDILYQYYKLDPSPKSIIKMLKASEFKKLSLIERDDFLLNLADEYRGHIQSKNPELRALFTSKLNKFIYHFMRKELGFSYKKLSDITVSVNPATQQMNVYRLSIEPIKVNLFQTKILWQKNFGFQIDQLALIPLKKVKQATMLPLNWRTETTEIRTELHLAPKKENLKLTKNSKSPNYQQLTNDGIYKGVVLVGNNMAELVEPLVGTYIRYYLSEGYNFVSYDKNVDTLNYIRQNMSGTEPMDFLAKEAHSDGDEKNLLRISKKSHVYRAEKITAEGLKLIIEIAAPENFNSGSVKISNNEFSALMKERRKNVGTELIYLNGSCWSLTKSLFETSAVNNSDFISIPAKTISLTFNDFLKNGTFFLFDGIQKMQTYEQIRKNLETLDSYKKRKADYYIFPDERVYQNEFTNFGLNQFDIEIKLQKKNGAHFLDYSIESDDLTLFK